MCNENFNIIRRRQKRRNAYEEEVREVPIVAEEEIREVPIMAEEEVREVPIVTEEEVRVEV